MRETHYELLKRLRKRSKELFSEGPYDDEPQSVGDPQRIFEPDEDDEQEQEEEPTMDSRK